MIANLISMHELEKLYQITYDSWEGYYIVHTLQLQGQVQFHMDKQGLPYIHLAQSGCMAAIMLMQHAHQQTTGSKGMALVQTVKRELRGLQLHQEIGVEGKEACCAQAMIGNPIEWDFKGMLSSNMIKN